VQLLFHHSELLMFL